MPVPDPQRKIPDEPWRIHRITRGARARAWLVFAAVAAGVLLARWLDPVGDSLARSLGDTPLSAPLFGLAGLLASAVLLLPGGAGRAAVLIACVVLGMAAELARLHERPRDDLLRLVGPGAPGEPPPLVRLVGRVLSLPRPEPPPSGAMAGVLTRFDAPHEYFPMRLETILADTGSRRVSGRVNVYAADLAPGTISPGRRVRVTGLLHRPAPPMNPGQADRVAWANQSGRDGWVRAGVVEPLPDRGGGFGGLAAGVTGAVARFRDAARARLDNLAAGHDVLAAMLLGERPPDSRQRALFARTGVAHLLAISGFHLAVLVALTVGVVRLTGDRPCLEAAVGLLAIAIYLAVVPARTPIVRASLLAATLLAAHFFSRRWDRLALLGWIAALLVLARPLDLLTLGYQLTVGVTALLLWLSDVRHPFVFGKAVRLDTGADPPWRAAVRWFRSLAVTSLIIWLAAAPVIILHTGSFNPITPLAVVVATPIATITQILGMAGLIASAFSAGLGSGLLAAAGASAGALGSAAAFFDTFPGRLTLAPVSAAWSAAAVGAVVYALSRARLRDPRPWAVLAIVVVWLAAEQAFAAGLPGRTAARIDSFSVGNGSCLLVRAGNDSMFWDAGSLTPGVGVRDIPRAVRALGAARVPVAVVTHANTDHYDALPDLAEAVGLRRVYIPAPELQSMQQAPPGSPESVFLDSMRARGVDIRPIARGDAIRLGPATLRVLWPPDPPPPGIREHNDRCAVARLDVPTRPGVRHALLTGDIGAPAMRALLDAGTPVAADILELPHHGSHHPFAERFVRAVAPAAVLQSTGSNRLNDRRWDGVKRELLARDGTWRITARDGASWAEILDSGEVRSGAVRVRASKARRTDGSR